jgi:hypothetical protein
MIYTAVNVNEITGNYRVYVAADAQATPTRTGYLIRKLHAGFIIENAGNVIANGYVFASVRHALAWLTEA